MPLIAFHLKCMGRSRCLLLLFIYVVWVGHDASYCFSFMMYGWVTMPLIAFHLNCMGRSRCLLLLFIYNVWVGHDASYCFSFMIYR